MSEFGDTIPYTVGNNTIDLSAQLEKQLNDQMSDDPLDMQEEENKNKTDNTEKPELHTVDLKTVDIKREVKTEEKTQEQGKEETPGKEQSKDKTISLINESKYLRYISELRKADSELALAKAESAELVRQMDNYRGHYTEYEEIIQKLIKEHNTKLEMHMQTLTELSQNIQKNSESLSSSIDREIQRLTNQLDQAIQGSIKESCDQELTKVGEATQVLYDYSEKVKSQYIRFQTLEKVKFGLFIFSSVSAPIVLIYIAHYIRKRRKKTVGKRAEIFLPFPVFRGRPDGIETLSKTGNI